jgi:hypothetical protein
LDWEEQVIGVEEIDFEEVPSQKSYSLLQTNIFQGSKPVILLYVKAEKINRRQHPMKTLS